MMTDDEATSTMNACVALQSLRHESSASPFDAACRAISNNDRHLLESPTYRSPEHGCT